MARKVKCAKLGIEAEGLDNPPFPGPEGQKIYDHISQQAWQEWLNVQTMLINEHRLTVFEPEAKAFLARERTKFLFGEGIDMPEGYQPTEAEQNRT
ncbi:MAG: oxidative damage protection protein [Methylothermaceae bacterium]|nr:oxidative damage protection protein [Methylothermaceae bacterium]